MTIVMGLDQHRAQITAEWSDIDTGEISRARRDLGNDPLSLQASATLDRWENDFASARSAIREALALAPDKPDLLFAAAELAAS